MRHGLRELPGHARRRRDRVLSRGVDQAHPLSPELRRSGARRWLLPPWPVPSRPWRYRRDTVMPKHASSPPSQRQLRVAELIRHAVADALTRGEIIDEGLAGRLVTVPEVRMSPDLRIATVFVMPLGGKEGKPVIKALASNAKYLRGLIARRVTLKFVPDLRFRLDETFDYA